MTDGPEKPPIPAPAEVPQTEQPAEPEPVSLESISSAPVEVPQTAGDSTAQLERETLAREYEGRRHARELGWMGKPFGGRNEKPGNISAAVVILCFLILGSVWGIDTWISVRFAGVPTIQPLMPFERVFSGIMSLLTLVLGYLFGSNDKDVK